jgi:hypothetical protein
VRDASRTLPARTDSHPGASYLQRVGAKFRPQPALGCIGPSLLRCRGCRCIYRAGLIHKPATVRPEARTVVVYRLEESRALGEKRSSTSRSRRSRMPAVAASPAQRDISRRGIIRSAGETLEVLSKLDHLGQEDAGHVQMRVSGVLVDPPC